jgi:hypothetical protein
MPFPENEAKGERHHVIIDLSGDRFPQVFRVHARPLIGKQSQPSIVSSAT